ncbi:CENP-B homolog protein 2-like [Euphorbia lathyris]|uniref:CENP-B homolog protein 2-like n=1 Tax=Euphorbia lathyris TaxID=212925 RepID=UPI0033131E88
MTWLENIHGLKVSQAAVSKTLKCSKDILQEEVVLNPNAKHQKMVKYPAMESALYEWFICHQEHVNMSGELLKEKGNYFLKELCPAATSFVFSNGWLEKFKQRHAIRSFRRFGESGSVDMKKIEAVLPKIKEKLDKWSLKDIYNMDETGLFYRMQADNSLATKQLEGRKQNKERITIAICCNADGSDKLPLWIIGKFLNPRCFKNNNRDSLNCKYQANSNAWMTFLIFNEWLQWFDNRMDRNVLLILDNCTAHGKKENFPPLRHTTVMFLPPNCTSKIQPCDAGIIRNFKGYYRQRFNRQLLKRIEDRVLEPAKISVLDGILNVVIAWSNDVKPQTIANCFKHCQIRTPDVDEGQIAKVMEEENKRLITNLEEQIKELNYHNRMDINEFLDHPSEQQVTYTLSEEEIVAAIQNDQEDNPADDDSVEIENVTCQEAFNVLERLETFWIQQEGVHASELLRTRKFKDLVANIKTKSMCQSTLDKYFLNNNN